MKVVNFALAVEYRKNGRRRTEPKLLLANSLGLFVLMCC